MIEVIKDTLIDGIKLLPFLFITYLIMEYLEHKTESKTTNIVRNAGRLGPLLGGILGIFPQCGFSAASASLYAGKVISVGTLIAVFLSTSDEMLPILISEAAPIDLIIKILLIKLVLGVVFGFIVDFIYKIIKKNYLLNKKKHNKVNKDKVKENNENTIKTENEETAEEAIGHMCEHEHCNCEKDGIFKSSVKHTLNIFIFIIAITFIINTIIYLIGEETVANLILDIPILGVAISCLIGLIPNCASSVIITELYLSNLISFGTMMAGLLVGSGVGILILFKSNKNLKENINILIILYLIGIICGLAINLIS